MTESSQAPTPAPGDRIDAYLARTAVRPDEIRVVRLTGDASDRTYYRVTRPGEFSRVAAVNAEPFDFATLPFARVAELLRRMPVPVPAIIEHHDDLGILLLEDLGDVTLQARLGGVDARAQAALYRQAVGLIVFLQRRGRELARPDEVPYTVAFDVEKLMWELDFFVKHFVRAYRDVVLDETLGAALHAACLEIATELAAERRVLCHRDYHSRNLMWHRDRLYTIDFQDARMGPDTYDLASLLRDSYVDLPETLVDEMIAHFLELGGSDDEPDRFRARFDLMALQRNLKALGTFGYQTTARANPVYIQYIPRTLRYVRDNLARHERFAGLRSLLAPLVPELV